MDAQEYFESLTAQNYPAEEAEKHTQEHYPDFSLAPTAPAPIVMPAPGVAMQDSVISGNIHQNITTINNLHAGAVLEVKQPNAVWRILNGISGIILSSVVVWLASAIKSDYDLAASYFAIFDIDVTSELESSLSFISFMLLAAIIVSVALFIVSIIQFVNTPWAAKALLTTNAVLMVILIITGYLEQSLVSDLGDDISLFETNGLFMSYCTGICFATFGLFAFLGRQKGPSVELQM